MISIRYHIVNHFIPIFFRYPFCSQFTHIWSNKTPNLLRNAKQQKNWPGCYETTNLPGLLLNHYCLFTSCLHPNASNPGSYIPCLVPEVHRLIILELCQKPFFLKFLLNQVQNLLTVCGNRMIMISVCGPGQKPGLAILNILQILGNITS